LVKYPPPPPPYLAVVMANKRFPNQAGPVQGSLRFLRTSPKRPYGRACNTPSSRSGDRARREKNFVLGIMILNIFLIFASCSSIQNGFYSFFIDSDGASLVENEPKIKMFLENIVDSYEQYSVKVYERTAIKFGIKRTKLLTHSYYLIINGEEEYHTLSFYGTRMNFYSEGVWALDTETDMESYKKYLEGNNKYDVIEIFTEDAIDVKRTIRNIIDRMNSNITYYYNDHIKNRIDMDNCNTALYETIAREGKGTNESASIAAERTLRY
jgi:hypothetical protein